MLLGKMSAYPTDITLTTFFTFINTDVVGTKLGLGLLFSVFMFIFFLLNKEPFEVRFASASWVAVLMSFPFLVIPIISMNTFYLFFGLAILSTALLIPR